MKSNAYRGRDYAWAPRKLEQGMLVSYNVPHAKQPELCGPQVGVVISSTQFNTTGTDQVLICPVQPENKDPTIVSHRVALLFKSGITKFLCPDLVTSVGPKFSNLEPILDGGKFITLPSTTVENCANKFIALISPTESKLHFFPNDKYPNYGMPVWFNVPQPQENIVDHALVICLTPRELSEKTGTILAIRTYSNIEKYHDQACVNLGERTGRRSYLKVNLVYSLSLLRKNPHHLAAANQQNQLVKATLGEIAKKIHATCDSRVFEEVKRQWPMAPGELPGRQRPASPHHS